MQQHGRPDYLELEQALGRAEAVASPAEVHGLLCGLLCAAGRLEENSWLAQVFVEVDNQNVAFQQGRAAVQQLASWTVSAMNDPVLGMDLVLPADAEPLAERTAALGEWCQGYLLGLAAGGVTQDTQLPEDAAELIRDFTDIAAAGFEVDASDEEDEVAFTDVVEYVRVGVLLINDELQPLQAPSRLQ
ncbi:MAG TPA: UPF0149 family protein [Gammaproteobacteria bacterium]|jgi:hypothetical protein|nr:UPF0149 family protein [Gammaproteobacteria bacterium]